jgi:hypothetical protein
METKITTPVVKGIIITLILIVFGLIIYFTGQINNKVIGSIQYIFVVAGIIWACISYANQVNGNVTFGNVFAHGFKTTTVVIALMCVYTFLSFKFIFPEIQDKIIEQARENMESQSKMSDEQVSQALEMTRKFFIPFALGGIIIMFAIIGAISSLIGAAVAKKNPQSPFTQQGEIL